MIDAFATLLGKLIQLIYELTSNNYGLSIIIFTILTKLIILPLSIKQVKTTESMNKIKPEYDKIMEKYKNNKEKQAEEISKLYANNKINPLGGCMLTLIQIPLIISMFYIVRQPLTYVVNMPQEEINIYAASLLEKESVTEQEAGNNEIQIAKKYGIIDMEFMGINFGDVPSNVFNKNEEEKVSPFTLIVPILSFILSIVQTKRSQANTNNNLNIQDKEKVDQQMEMQKSMNIMMPLLSASISYSMPLALGIYWLLGSVFTVVQQELMKLYLNKEKSGENHLMLDSKKGGMNNE